MPYSVAEHGLGVTKGNALRHADVPGSTHVTCEEAPFSMACDAAATSAPTRMKRALLGAQGEQPAARRAEMAVAPISCAPVALAQAAKEWVRDEQEKCFE